MCGIGLLASFPITADKLDGRDDLLLDWNNRLSRSLASRGPDLPGGQLTFAAENIIADAAEAGGGSISRDDQRWSVTLHASVLHMRGQCPVEQPLLFSIPLRSTTSRRVTNNEKDGQNFALCWNGECYSYDDSHTDEVVSGDDIHSREFGNTQTRISRDMVELLPSKSIDEQSDTTLVATLIQDAISTCSIDEEHRAISEAMSRIHGEFSFILFASSSNCVYYGRDCIGRRSLLVNKSLHGVMAVSSVAITESDEEFVPNFSNDWEEILPGIVHRFDASTGEVSSIPIVRVVKSEILEMAQIPTILPTNNYLETRNIQVAAEILLSLLSRAVQRRVVQAPPPKSQSPSDASVAVLFSGGIDSVVIAALCDRHVPPNQPIDLINVSFYANTDRGRIATHATSPDRQAAILSYHELQLRFPERIWRLIAVDVPYQNVLYYEKHILKLICPLESTMDFNIAVAFWFASRGEGRILGADELNSKVKKSVAESSRLLRFSNEDELFHGASKMSPKCIRQGCTRFAVQSCIFQSCRTCCGKLQGPISAFLGKRVELCRVHNQRSVDTPKYRNEKLRASEILHSHSTHPVSINDGDDNNTYATIMSQAKILLSGVGADEQMAGYGRHRTTYQRGGHEALRSELRMEVNRLWTRNLGRDDRCLSDHGMEARFPYLDEDVMTYLDKLPLELKCDMTLPLGEGDKRILRNVAQMIGVMECSNLVKRAIQFGSRIAKVSDKSRFGSGRRATGQQKIVADKST